MNVPIKTKHNQINIIHILTILFLTGFTLSGCAQSKNAPVSKTFFAFDTVITITLYDNEQTELLNECEQLCTEYDQLFSKTIPTSDVYKLNHANGIPVKVDAKTYELIKKSISYSRQSKGAFDITIGGISGLWDFAKEPACLPDSASITEALSHVGYQNIVLLDQSEIKLADSKTQIDLGGIAKGYIADRIKEYLISENVTNGIIDLGGNILTIGSRPDNSPYHIGIKEPFSKTGNVLTSVNVTDQSVVTSGIYERYFIKDEKIYHHIFSPSTGYPIDNELTGVTIISSQSVDGDALSSICLILGPNEGMKLIEETDGIEAIFITKDNQIIKSSGINTY